MPDDQLMDLSEKLSSHAARPEEAVKILKVLENVAITYDQLIKTKIGKRLTALKEDVSCEEEIMEKLKKLKQDLEENWRNQVRKYKEDKKQK